MSINIAIDGFSSCGKSTLAKQLAKKLGLTYIDSGAMYRCIALYALQKNYLDLNGWLDKDALVHELPEILISFSYVEGEQHAFLNGEDVEAEIRTMKVSNVVSIASQDFAVRTYCVNIQQNWVRNKGVVMDGRDIGTVVIPNAELKLFMTADAVIRANRRLAELRGKGDFNTTLQEVVENLEKRDYDDLNRTVSPLKKATDAIEINNSNLTMEEQLQLALDLMDRKMVKKKG